MTPRVSRHICTTMVAAFVGSLLLLLGSIPSGRVWAQSGTGKTLAFRPTGTGSPLTQTTIEKFRALVREDKKDEDEARLLQELAQIEKKKGFVTWEDLRALWLRYEDDTRKTRVKTLIVQISPGQLSPEIEPQAVRLLSNGKTQSEASKDWVATQKLGIEDYRCTATLIGPRVLLTAAHCLPPGSGYTIPLNMKEYALDCERHPAYADVGFRSQFDYGLCRAREDFPRKIEIDDPEADKQDLRTSPRPKSVAVDLKFERLSLEARHAAPDLRDINSRWPLLSGYGCSDRQMSKPDGRLRAGFARISQYAELRLVTGSPYRDDSAIVCQGDSGGAAYRLVPKDAKVRFGSPGDDNPDNRNPYGSRVIIGINSANILERNLSFLAKTSTPAFVWFFHAWRKRNGNPKVCGVNRDLEWNTPLGKELCHD